MEARQTYQYKVLSLTLLKVYKIAYILGPDNISGRMISEMQMARIELSKSTLPLHFIQTVYDSLPKRIFRVLPIWCQKSTYDIWKVNAALSIRDTHRKSQVFLRFTWRSAISRTHLITRSWCSYTYLILNDALKK